MARSKESNRGYQGSESISVDDFRAGLRSGEIEILPLSEPIKQKAEASQTPEGQITLAEAKRIMGPELFRGPEQVEQVFGFRPDVLPIPFSTQELKRAQELGQTLRRRVRQTPEGILLSAYAMRDILASNFTAKEAGSVPIYDPVGDWKRGEDCWEKEAPEDGWVLTSPDLIPNSTPKNFIEQLDLAIAELKGNAYQDQPLPKQYQEAIAEYDREKSILEPLALSNDETKWKPATVTLSNLKIVKLLIPTVSEVCQDLYLDFLLTGTRNLNSNYTRTRSLSSGGGLVSVGNFGAGGVSGGGGRPLGAYGAMGASFSRSVSR